MKSIATDTCDFDKERTWGSGPYWTNYTKCWMQELGVKKNYLLTKGYLFIA